MADRWSPHEEAEPDLLLLLGTLNTTSRWSRQGYWNFPASSVVPGPGADMSPRATTTGVRRFRTWELLPADGTLIDGVGYLHGHTHPAPDLPGHLVVVGHHHPVVSLVDSVGCAARARPAYLYSTVEEPSGERTRLLFVPAFNEFAGGIDVGRLRESGLGPLSRCIDEKNAEVFLADGTYVGSPATLCPADDR